MLCLAECRREFPLFQTQVGAVADARFLHRSMNAPLLLVELNPLDRCQVVHLLIDCKPAVRVVHMEGEL